MKIGRNQPCPCGSGKKYKNCCLLKQNNMVESFINKIYKIILTHYLDDLIDAFEIVCSYVFDYMPINIDDKRDESFYYEIDQYLKNNNYEYEFLISIDYLVFDWLDLGLSAEEQMDIIWADIVEEEFPDYFTDEELDIIFDNFYKTHLSLFEVIDVIPGEKVFVRDLFTNEEYTVIEHKGSFQIQKYDCLLTRVVEYNNKHFFSFIVMPVPKSKQEDIVQTILDIYKKEVKKAKLSLKNFLKIFPFFLTNTVYFEIQKMEKIKLATTTGEELKFCTINYKILDYDTLIKKLDTIEEFDKATENKKEKSVEYFWFGGKLEGKSSSPETNRILNVNKSHFVKGPTGNVSLGHIYIKDNNLKAECNSEKRLKRLKDMLNKNAKNLLKFESQDIKTANEMMLGEQAEEISEKTSKAEEIPPEIKQEMLDKFYLDYYKNLFTEKIPALNNKSPEKCLQTKEGRKLLYKLLHQYENIELHKKAAGEYWFDINNVYKLWNLPKN